MRENAGKFRRPLPASLLIGAREKQRKRERERNRARRQREKKNVKIRGNEKVSKLYENKTLNDEIQYEEYRQLAPGNSVHTFLYNTTDSRSKLC